MHFIFCVRRQRSSRQKGEGVEHNWCTPSRRCCECCSPRHTLTHLHAVALGGCCHGVAKAGMHATPANSASPISRCQHLAARQQAQLNKCALCPNWTPSLGFLENSNALMHSLTIHIIAASPFLSRALLTTSSALVKYKKSPKHSCWRDRRCVFHVAKFENKPTRSLPQGVALCVCVRCKERLSLQR